MKKHSKVSEGKTLTVVSIIILVSFKKKILAAHVSLFLNLILNTVTFIDGVLVDSRKQPLSLLASAIKMLEKKPRQPLVPKARGYVTDDYSRLVRPRSAYVVLKNGNSQSSLSSSNQNGCPSNGLQSKLSSQKKQHKAKQNLYMSLISPNGSSIKNSNFGCNGYTMPHRVRPPPHMQLSYGQHKANTLPRYRGNDGKRIKMNRKDYMDMIRPITASSQYYNVGANRSVPATPSSQRTISRQSHYSQNLSPKPPNESQRTRRQQPDSVTSTPQQERHHARRQIFVPHKETFPPQRRPPSQQSRVKNEPFNHSNGSSFMPDRNIHLPKLTGKTKDQVSLSSSTNPRTRGQIPNGHPDNVIPLYFRKSLAYSPQYRHKELLFNPL